MAKVNSGKVTKGMSGTPKMGGPKGQPAGTKPMPRVGGHTSNTGKGTGC